MPVTLTAYAGGDTLTAAGLLSRVDEVETWLNGGIVAADYDATPFVSSANVIRPDFIPTPQRAVMQTCEINHNTVTDDRLEGFVIADDVLQNAWTPIPGLWRTVDVQPSTTESTAKVIVRACFHAYEQEGTAAAGANEAARFALFRDPNESFSATAWTGGARRIYNTGTTVATNDAYRQWHFLEGRWTGITRGRHSFGVACYMIHNGGTARLWKFAWVRARAIIVRVVYR
ncbi:MAG TPA: hypothetical protein VI911_04365 [Patescibacteria group bacterium]|nr:hypothetical protein [Patescibacteria group bacterium]